MKILTACSALLLGLVLCITPAYATPVCSDWAVEEIEAARSMAMIPMDVFYDTDLSQPLTRYDMASLLTSLYTNIRESTYIVLSSSPSYTDVPTWTFTNGYLTWTSKASYEASDLYFPVESGIMVGTSETTFSPTNTLTRQEFAKIMVEMIYYMKGTEVVLPTDPVADFSDFDEIADWAQPYVVLATEAGILNGYDDGRFAPTDSITWEQVFSVFVRTYDLSTVEIPVLTYPVDGQVLSSEEALIITSNFESDYTAYILNEDGDLYGSIYKDEYGGAKFISTFLTSGEAYILFVESNGGLSDPVTVYADTVKADAFDIGGVSSAVTVTRDSSTNLITISIDPAIDGTYFQLQVVERRNATRGDLIDSQEKLSVSLEGAQTYTFQGDYKRIYEITLTSWNETIVETLYTGSASRDSSIVSAIYANGAYATAEEASAAMVSVEIPVWRLIDGEKVADTTIISVNPLLADVFLSVFTEIFNGPEQFPIKDVGAYSWRGSAGSSTHNEGIAIDINANENYCVYSNGTTVGSYWSPYEDPYSITPYGDVVRAFENHGFTWGGDAWPSPQDYMHFNYLDSV